MYGDRDNNTCAIPTCDPGRWTNTHERKRPDRYLSLKKIFLKKFWASEEALTFHLFLFSHFLYILYHTFCKKSNFHRIKTYASEAS